MCGLYTAVDRGFPATKLESLGLSIASLLYQQPAAGWEGTSLLTWACGFVKLFG